MAQAGAVQYLCPGVCGWNQWINMIEDSYQNIIRMCGYARKYRAEGILNTDWGDFGHVNDPMFSVPGMIYGAAFSWNQEEIGFDEINRQISFLEYGDDSQKVVTLMAQLTEQSLFDWWKAVTYYEKQVLHHEKEIESILPETLGRPEDVAKAEEKLRALRRQLKETAVHMREESRPLIEALDLAGEAISLWNAIGNLMYVKESGGNWDEEETYRLAGRLESWFMAYKKQWRQASREGDLHHIAEIVFWYADCLRGRART